MHSIIFDSRSSQKFASGKCMSYLQHLDEEATMLKASNEKEIKLSIKREEN